VKVDDFGAVDVFTGSTDMGQGADTVIAQMVAEEMGVSRRCEHPRQGYGRLPLGCGRHASRTTFVAGNSAIMASRRVKERILNLAAGFVIVGKTSRATSTRSS